jgi:hypothetical protein
MRSLHEAWERAQHLLSDGWLNYSINQTRCVSAPLL